MSNVKASPVKSIFASIDKRSEDFIDDVALAKSFTSLILSKISDFSEVDVEMVHLDGTDETPKKDFEGKEGVRRYAIWKENQNYFGAWVFCYEDRNTQAGEDEILYPQILGPVIKKSHEIVEDVYYIKKLALPVAWVTYHNAQ
jgi:hypothetical protein